MTDKRVLEEGDREKVLRTWRHILTKETLGKDTEILVLKTLLLLEDTADIRSAILKEVGEWLDRG